MNFKQFYIKESKLNIPLDFDHIRVNESGDIELELEMKYIKEYVDMGLIILETDGRKFKTLKEAYEGYDKMILNEADKPKKLPKNITKVIDPETGEEREFEVSLGNIKVGGNTICINMSTAHDCMSLIIGTCSLGANGQCYALSSEKRFKGSIEKSERSSKSWSCLTPAGLAKGLTQLMEKMPGIEFLRLNNAGEFRNLPSNPEMLAKVPDAMKEKLAGVDDVKKLIQLGEELIKIGNPITIYTYTHRTDLTFEGLPENVCLNGSGYMISNAFVPLDYENYNEVLDRYEAGTLKELNGEAVNKVVKCMGDCRKCPWCKEANGNHILIAIHGATTKTNRAIASIVNSVISKPAFAQIILKDSIDQDKARELINLISAEDKKILNRIVVLPADQRDLFVNLIKSQGDITLFTKAMERYAGMTYGDADSLNTPIDTEMKNDALIASVDNLVGKFEANQTNARALGQKAAINKWTKLAAQLKKAITDTKAGKKVKPSKALAGHFGATLKNK